MCNPFRYFNSSPEVIRLAVMMYVRLWLIADMFERHGEGLILTLNGPRR